jgi:uncharacterized SAM-binding protein YcdF (DUF218 family)
MKKVSKIVKRLFIFAIGLLVLDFLCIVFFSLYSPKLQKADMIVVLGAAINTPASYNRSLQGLKLYEQGLAPVIVLSGGQDFPGAVTEAKYMEAVIQSNSKKPVPIILEDESHSTYDNINFTKQKFGNNVGSIIIVSDSYHLARASIMAYREGFRPVYYSSPEINYYGFQDLIYYYVREMLAMISYIPKFIFA